MPPTRRRDEVWFAAAETAQAQGAFPLDQRFQGFVQQSGPFAAAGQGFGPGQKIVIDCDSRSHGHTLSALIEYGIK
jgi:hypothetical protein